MLPEESDEGQKSNDKPKRTREASFEVEAVWAEGEWTPEQREMQEYGLRILAWMIVRAILNDRRTL